MLSDDFVNSNGATEELELTPELSNNLIIMIFPKKMTPRVYRKLNMSLEEQKGRHLI